MEDIISRLFSLIPVVLALIWLIQFIEKIRRQRQAANRKLIKPVKDVGGASRKSSETFLRADVPGELASKQSEIFPKNRQMAGPANRNRKTDSLNSLNIPPSPIEKVRSYSPKRLTEKEPVVVSGNLEQGARVVKDKATRAETSIRRKTLDSIRARSPLAQAMLWKIIFDRPSALKELDE